MSTSTIIRRCLLALPLLIAGWIGTIAAIGLVSDGAPAAVVVLPPSGFLAELEADFVLLSAGPASVTLASDQPDVALRLYRAGAWLVLPAGLPGCLPMLQAR